MQDLHVLLLGEAPVQSSPLRTLSQALSGIGLKTSVSPGIQRHSAVECARFRREYDAIVFIHYDEIPPFGYRQFAIARASGIPIVRWWVGTDVFNCLTDESTRRSAKKLDQLIDENIAVAPHLVDELHDCGISARFIPSVIKDIAPRHIANVAMSPKAVLIYLPSHRWEFYCGPLMEQVIADNPSVVFVVVADVEHRLAQFPNVKSLGWVEDMDGVLDKVGVLLRITQHDGLPRMAIECLLRRQHVIYSWKLAGCSLAKSLGEVNAAVRRFAVASVPNDAGRLAALELMTPNPADSFVRRIAAAVEKRSFKRQFRAAIGAFSYLVGDMGRRVVRVSSQARGTAIAGVNSNK